MDVLAAHCGECHSSLAQAQLLDTPDALGALTALVSAGYVVPANAKASPVYQQSASGEMPPPDSGVPPLEQWELDLLALFIETPSFWPPAPVADCGAPPSFTDFDRLFESIAADVATLPGEDAPFYRYISLSNRANVVCSDTELERDRQALTKGLNMLSQNPRLVLPHAIDDARHIYRIDLRELDWKRSIDVGSRKFQDVWEAIAADDPYAVRFAGDAAASARAATGSAYPVLFADHLLDRALSGELYYAILGALPGETWSDFSTRRFELDQDYDPTTGVVQRAVTSRSRITRDDLQMERQEVASQAVLWETYNYPRYRTSSVYDDPLDYEWAAQALFTLPNGLLAFVSVDVNGSLVSDTTLQLDSLPYALPVSGAFTCSACHASGLGPVVDELRDVAERDGVDLGYDATELEKIRQIYPTASALGELIAGDSAIQQQALSALQLPTTGSDPVAAAALRLVEPLTLQGAAAELGVRPESLADELPRVSAWLSPLETGTIERDRFAADYRKILCVLSESSANRPGFGECD